MPQQQETHDKLTMYFVHYLEPGHMSRPCNVVFAESGQVTIERSIFDDNRAGLPHVRDGLGGALSLRERCVNEGTECTLLETVISDSEIRGNVAQLAGGGVYVAGGNPQSWTTVATPSSSPTTRLATGSAWASAVVCTSKART